MQLSRYVLSHKLDSGKDKELLDTIFEEVKTYWEKRRTLVFKIPSQNVSKILTEFH